MREPVPDAGGDHGADAERLTTRIAVLLEETAHQGLLALRLLVQARDLVTRAGATDDVTMRALLAELEEKLVRLEGEGRERLRNARRLLRSAVAPTPGPAQRGRGTRSVRSQR